MANQTHNLLGLVLAAFATSCRTTEVFPGPAELPPQSAPSQAVVPEPPSSATLAQLADAGAPLIAEAGATDPYAPHDSLRCEDRHSAFSCFVTDRKASGDLVRTCAKTLAEGSGRTTGFIAAYLNPDGSLLTVRTQVSPYSPAFVGCIESGARRWIHKHPKGVHDKDHVRFAVDAKSPER